MALPGLRADEIPPLLALTSGEPSRQRRRLLWFQVGRRTETWSFQPALLSHHQRVLHFLSVHWSHEPQAGAGERRAPQHPAAQHCEREPRTGAEAALNIPSSWQRRAQPHPGALRGFAEHRKQPCRRAALPSSPAGSQPLLGLHSSAVLLSPSRAEEPHGSGSALLPRYPSQAPAVEESFWQRICLLGWLHLGSQRRVQTRVRPEVGVRECFVSDCCLLSPGHSPARRGGGREGAALRAPPLSSSLHSEPRPAGCYPSTPSLVTAAWVPTASLALLQGLYFLQASPDNRTPNCAGSTRE